MTRTQAIALCRRLGNAEAFYRVKGTGARVRIVEKDAPRAVTRTGLKCAALFGLVSRNVVHVEFASGRYRDETYRITALGLHASGVAPVKTNTRIFAATP